MSQLRLQIGDLEKDPYAQFVNWYQHALDRSGLPNPNAMTLCTVTADGWPEGRPVLLKTHDAKGLVFYTNFHSAKGQALLANPKAELVFHWDTLGRQIRVQGTVEAVSNAEADAYFATRPRASQIGAWASDQGEKVASFEVMDQKLHDSEQKYSGIPVPRPLYWSGFRVLPMRYEFWQADSHRFHDRFRYFKTEQGWELSRIYP